MRVTGESKVHFRRRVRPKERCHRTDREQQRVADDERGKAAWSPVGHNVSVPRVGQFGRM
jgi:hypothetical protein